MDNLAFPYIDLQTRKGLKTRQHQPVFAIHKQRDIIMRMVILSLISKVFFPLLFQVVIVALKF